MFLHIKGKPILIPNIHIGNDKYCSESYWFMMEVI